jgi:hypothetical protein
MKKEIENRHKCPKRIWNKLSERGKIAYNNIRGMKRSFILPPKVEMTDGCWDVISHNFACLTAWEFPKKVVK